MMTGAGRGARIVMLTLAAGSALAIPAAAHPGSQSVLVSASVRGSQATTRRLERSARVQGCTLRTVLDGSQMIRFATRSSQRLLVLQTSRRSALWPYAGTERPGLPPVTVNASVDREADMVSGQAVYGPTGVCGRCPGGAGRCRAAERGTGGSI